MNDACSNNEKMLDHIIAHAQVITPWEAQLTYPLLTPFYTLAIHEKGLVLLYNKATL